MQVRTLSARGAIVCLLGAMYAGSARAQDEPPRQRDAVLEEITVTAQRREERLQDVPIAVVALDADSLQRRGIDSTKDLQFSSPSLVINSLAGFAQPYLRGIGGEIVSPNADQGVAMYVDGVYNPNTVSSISSLLGIQRIEVLYGPQGTLYGRNAVGGAINIITLTPRQELESRVSASLGNYAARELSGHVSGGVTDKLALGLYAGGTIRNSYIARIHPAPLPGEPDHEQSWGARLKLAYAPTGWLTVTGTAEHQSVKSFEANAFRQGQDNAVGFAVGAPFILERYVFAADTASWNTLDLSRAALHVEADLGSSKLRSITSWQTAENSTIDDIDGTLAPLVGSGSDARSNHSFSQELQWLAASERSVQWIVGLYAFSDHGGFDPNYTLLQSLITQPELKIEQHSLVDTDSYAAFSQVTWPLSDALRVTLGGRYTRDKKKWNGRENLQILATGQVLTETFYPDSETEWSKFTPKITLDYRIGDTLLYATYSKGFKAGTYNISLPARPGPVNPEVVNAYEVGTKSDFGGGRFRVNTSAYFYDYKDLQVTAFEVGTGSASSFLQNAASAENYGGDISGAVAITPELFLSAGASYLHATYSEFPRAAASMRSVVGNVPVSVDATGNRLVRAPEWSTSVNADYTRAFANGGALGANVGWYYNGGYFWDAANFNKAEPFHIVNSSVSYTTSHEQWTFSLWGRNITDSYYNAAILAFDFGLLTQDAPPRMYGVNLTYNFN